MYITLRLKTVHSIGRWLCLKEEIGDVMDISEQKELISSECYHVLCISSEVLGTDI